jgi:hypothetical protein
MLRQNRTILETIFYTFAWSLTVTLSVESIGSVVSGVHYFPVTVIVPVLTLILLAYDYTYNPRRRERDD